MRVHCEAIMPCFDLSPNANNKRWDDKNVKKLQEYTRKLERWLHKTKQILLTEYLQFKVLYLNTAWQIFGETREI